MDKFDLKLGFCLTSGLSAILTAYLMVEEYRKYKKQQLKAEKKRLKLEYKQKLQKENEGDAPKTEETHSPRRRKESFFKLDLKKIVLTGGPCAGKTTAMTEISSKLRDRGTNVLIVPEFATLIANGGGLINIHKMTMGQIIKLQSVIMKGIMTLEDNFCELAEINGGSAVILCDRGVMDGKAYIKSEAWQVLLDENEYTLVNLRDKRYDAVIHLVTAADGAEAYYKLDNNPARYEQTKELAVEIDRKIRDAWVGHPSFMYVDNVGKTFETKIAKVFENVLNVLGLPKATKFYRKYLLSKEKNDKDGLPWIPEKYRAETVTLEDTFLNSNDLKIERKIRKRGVKDSFIYIYSQTVYAKPINQMTDEEFKYDGIQRKRQITAREYMSLFEERDPTRKTLTKIRQCFIYQEQYFLIDTYTNVEDRFSLLMIEASKDMETVKIPDFLQIDKDVTNRLNFTSYTVAEKKPEEIKAEKN
mmetsp:Transcript_3817/g.4240  ORF Transcript_3817/g.4240 Transcript_3817/m.4240 type:complete len:473 (+) Transcript_3817:48-1466(+)